MYDLKIFNTKKELFNFINKNKIKDFTFNKYNFELKLKTKTIKKENDSEYTYYNENHLCINDIVCVELFENDINKNTL